MGRNSQEQEEKVNIEIKVNENNDVSGGRILFEMQVSGFLSDLPPEEEDGVEGGNVGSYVRRYELDDREAGGGESGWSKLSQLFGFTSARSKAPVLSPIWTHRYVDYYI